jgi:hypothetical protein
MKKYHLILFLGMLLSAEAVRSQITLSLALNPRPQPYLSDWMYPINGQMIISYFAGPVVNDPNIKLRTTLLDQSGNPIGVSNLNAARIITLRQGVNQFTMADALQLQNLMLSGNLQSLLQRTGRLPAGQYQLSVEVMNTSGDIVRAKQIQPFSITSYRLPVLIQPANEAKLDAHIAQTMITFRWTSLVPNSSEQTFYRVQVFEILPGQTPMQAFRGNRPILDEPTSGGNTQYIWQPNLPMLDSTANYQFIWTIQTLDAKGMPVPSMDMNTQGRSEPAVFRIVNQTGAIDKNRKNEDSNNR